MFESPTTGVGFVRHSVVPSPPWPCWFAPQQRTVWSSSTAPAWRPPVATCVSTTQTLLEQATSHSMPQPPQFFASIVVLTHSPLQSVGLSGGHTHWPSTQITSFGHSMPQPPQLFGSFEVLTHWSQ